MLFENWIAFVLASTVVLVIPGPTVITVVSHSVALGRRASIPLAAAVALGDSTAALASMFGLGTIFAASAFWFTAVKWFGCTYLIFLGIKLLRARGLSARPDASLKTRHSLRSVLVNTYVVTALNPKSIVFFMAFLPQFLDYGAPLARQLSILAITFVLLAAVNAALYSALATSATATLSSPLAQRRFQIAGGSLLTAAGIWGLLVRRSA